jgi:hypothetical protein
MKPIVNLPKPHRKTCRVTALVTVAAYRSSTMYSGVRELRRVTATTVLLVWNGPSVFGLHAVPPTNVLDLPQ